MKKFKKERQMSSDLNRSVTKDDIAIINGVCKGRSLDFTTEFMTCLPQIIQVSNKIGWINGVKPVVEDGAYLRMNGAVRWYKDDQPQVVGSLAYLNRYPINIDNIGESAKKFTFEYYDGINALYTGWACIEAGNEYNNPHFELLEDHQVVAWKPFPVFEG